MSTDLSEPIEHAVTRIEPDVSIEAIAETWTRAQAYLRGAKEIMAQLEERCKAWIEANGRDIRWAADDQGNEMILTLAHNKSVKCKSPVDVLDVLFTHSDWEAVAACLAANCWKYGAVRKLLAEIGKPELYDELFVTEIRTKLKDGSPTPKELQVIDQRYLK